MSTYQVFVCPTCACRRRIYRTRQNDWYVWRCSKKHAWYTKVPTIEKIVEATKAALLQNISTLFNRDNPFYRELGRHR